ncbi:MAG: hypothetical protein U0L15_04910 [Oscillospiraceae bacterium]|nr:hypothetical protein [Oscillospiraceae bacterium]
MDMKTHNTLLFICAAGLVVAGIIFLALCFFDDGSAYLPAGLGCISLANLFNVIRCQNKKDNTNNEN